MARKLPGLQRVLDAPSLAAVAYGEIASSIYLALGVVTLYALGLTPWVLLLVGGIFFLVALSYAEGTAAMPEPGGAATFVRRAFNDPAGFTAGWALFLDYLVVIALAGHYVGAAFGWHGLRDSPWDIVTGIGVIVVVSLVRLVRRAQLYRIAVAVAAIALVTHLLLVGLGFAYLFSAGALHKGVHLGSAPTWGGIAFALALSTLAYTGLETVANLAAEVREPGKTLPRSLFAGIGAVVVVYVLMALVGVSAYPATVGSGPAGGTTGLGDAWVRAPLVGIAAALDGPLPHGLVRALEIVVGVSGALVLIAAVTTSVSGAGRLAYSMGRYDMLPRAYARLNRRTLIPPITIVTSAVIASALLVAAAVAGNPVRFLASLYSFGILIAFTAAQLAVIRLRFSEPDLPRPFRVPGNVTIRGRPVPVAPLVGAPLTFALWIAALATHDAARIAGPAWAALGFAVFVAVRRSEREPVLEHVEPAAPDLVPEAAEGAYTRLLVPLKLGAIGEEILATALKLAEEQGATVHVLHVIRVPLELSLEAEMLDEEERAQTSIAEAQLIASEHGVEVEGTIVRHRALGEAIVEMAEGDGTDLIVLGSAPRWRRQSRFFSPTVDYVLRRAPCEVMVVAYPRGVLEEITVAP